MNQNVKTETKEGMNCKLCKILFVKIHLYAITLITIKMKVFATAQQKFLF
jgi:hypothetical protein